jgi:hypothetical protein
VFPRGLAGRAVERQPGGDLESAAGQGARVELAAVQPGSFGHSGDSVTRAGGRGPGGCAVPSSVISTNTASGS